MKNNTLDSKWWSYGMLAVFTVVACGILFALFLEAKHQIIRVNKELLPIIDSLTSDELASQKVRDEKKALKARTQEIITKIRSLHGPEKLSIAEAKEQAKEILTNSMYESTDGSEYGYYFVYDRNGTNIFHPIKSDWVGKNKINYQDRYGKYVIRDLINTAIKNGEEGGFENYIFHQLSRNKALVDAGKFKISYIALIKDFDWVVGTGTYLGEVDGILKHFDNAMLSNQQDLKDTFLIIFGALVVGFFSMILISRKLIVFHIHERIARKLHTHVQQDLGYLVHRYDKFLSESNTGEFNQLMIERSSIKEQANRIKRALKNIILILDNKDPYNQIFNDELIALKKEFEEEELIPIQILASKSAIDLSRNLSRAKKKILLDVVRQALQNIAQYAAATKIVIQLEVRERNLVLTVSDNGIGFNIDEVDVTKSRGLSDIEKNLIEAGGKLEIISPVPEFESGARIIATMPIKQSILDYFGFFQHY